jgi:hypothetical protein
MSASAIGTATAINEQLNHIVPTKFKNQTLKQGRRSATMYIESQQACAIVRRGIESVHQLGYLRHGWQMICLFRRA